MEPTSRDISVHRRDLGHCQPVPDICKFVYETRTEYLRYHTPLGYHTCSCALRNFSRIDTPDGNYHVREVSWIQGLPTAGQHVRSIVHPPLGLHLAVEGKEGRDRPGCLRKR